jgi:hypothetical protein
MTWLIIKDCCMSIVNNEMMSTPVEISPLRRLKNPHPNDPRPMPEMFFVLPPFLHIR